uniref:Gustatory receptor n=1 Tax=Tetranychus urticae TaxID=32264 RepID=T1K3R7_TETUR
MNPEEPRENHLVEIKCYYGTYKRLFLFTVNLICFALVIALYSYTWDFQLNSKMNTFAMCRATINIILVSFRFIIILFLIKRHKTVSYLENLHEIGVGQDCQFKGFITRHQMCKNVVFSIFVVIELALNLGHFFANYNLLGVGEIVYFFMLLIYPNVNLLIIREIIGVSIYLQVAFKLVNSRVDSLMSKQAIDPNSLKSYRRHYSYAVKATRSVENYFRCYVTFFYVQYACYNIMNIVCAFGPHPSKNIFWLFHFIVDTLLMIYLTIKLVSVNFLSRKSLDNLYEISFELDTMELKYENAIFMGRVLFTDVGFTFANLFTINTQFIASMMTLSLTIILALANFLYE